MTFRLIAILVCFLFSPRIFSQTPQKYSTVGIIQQLDRLNTLGSVLYVAAHPDDENTQFISYMSNERNYRTAYLSATRGDGGQNLIGSELRDELGVIRTNELLAARSIDGGEQFFSRANDFGYSRNPEETFKIWNRDSVLADFVWVIRKFRPDVIVTRFSRESGASHGHHTASAILAMEAFEMSGDSLAFPDQLAYVDPWSPSRIFYNIGLWSYRRSGKVFDETGYLKMDVGGFDPILGSSYTEIAAKSRSMHKSQGFGVTGRRGSEYEYFEQWGGDPVDQDLFEGLNTSWDRVEGSEGVTQAISEARLSFDPANPSGILPHLLIARKELLKLPNQYWKEIKLMELEQLILSVTGTYLEVTTSENYYVPGDSIQLDFEIINRSDVDMQLSALRIAENGQSFIHRLELTENEGAKFSYWYTVPEESEYSSPYWLEQSHTQGMYRVDEQLKIGLPVNESPINAFITVKVRDQFIDYKIPVTFKYNNPTAGEVHEPLVIVPKVVASLDEEVVIFPDVRSKKISVRLQSFEEQAQGILRLSVPKGWTSVPEQYDFDIVEGIEKNYDFELVPPTKESLGEVTCQVIIGSDTLLRSMRELEYEHIPKQTLLPRASATVVKMKMSGNSGRIGYIMGAGDLVPESLERIGFEVVLLQEEDMVPDILSEFDAVITGVRAFNTLDWLAYKNESLFEYVESGGNLIVQYNTNHRLMTERVSPYELKLSRDRVTDESSPVRFLKPDHPVLNSPNTITSTDFEGWVQERGLYFPSEWSEEFVPVIGMNDDGREESKGALLIANYGKGYYCYTGLSFFRELPAGVPGAYRLLINMISLDKPLE